MAIRIATYVNAFEGVLGIKFDSKWKEFVTELEKEGHKEKSIAYAIWRSQDKLNSFKGDRRFLSILKNEICKWSWSRDDPRWKEYNKRKAELAAAATTQYELEQKEAAEHERLKRGYVYFIQGESGGAIKIGHSKDPELRLKTLQTGYPDTLKILLIIPGSEKMEEKLHEKFNDIRLNGEWFKPDIKLLNAINILKCKLEQKGNHN